MNVVGPLCFASHRLLWTFHVSRSSTLCGRHHISTLVTTSHHILPLVTTSHLYISPRLTTPHHVISFIATTDTPRKHNQPPQKHYRQTEWPKAGAHKKLRFGHRMHWLVALISNFFFGVLFFSVLKLPPPACPALLVYTYTLRICSMFDH